MNGAGAAAISICRLLLKAGFNDVTLCDRKGAIYEGRTEGMNPVKEEMSKAHKPSEETGISCRDAGWRGCIYRCFRTWSSYNRDG